MNTKKIPQDSRYLPDMVMFTNSLISEDLNNISLI
jgi:hypothetical protein